MTQKRLCPIDGNIRLTALAIGFLFFIAACNTGSTPAMLASATTATPVSEVLSPVATFVMTPQAHYSPPEPPACAADISFVAQVADGPIVLYQPEQDPVVLRDTIGTDFISFYNYSPDGRFVAHGFGPVAVYDAQTGISTIVLEDASIRSITWNTRSRLLIDTFDDGTYLYNPFDQTITRLHPKTEFGEFIFFHGWTHNGRYLYYSRATAMTSANQREWIIYDDDTGDHHIILTETHPDGETWGLFLAWSPDLRHAVLRLTKRDTDDVVYERTRFLMKITDFSLSPLESIDGEARYLWMGDSSGLLYRDGDTRILRYDLSNQTTSPFYESDTFHLYPGFIRNDTHWIARFTAELDANDKEVLTFHSFQRIAYDGTPLDTVAFSDIGAWTIRISPGGSAIAYSTNPVSYESGPIQLYDVESGEATMLEGDFYRSFEWINNSILLYQSQETGRTLFYDVRLENTCEFPDAFQTVDLRFPKGD